MNYAQYLFCEEVEFEPTIKSASVHCSGVLIYLFDMTKLLKEAIETLRELPEEEQDAAADVLFAYISNDERHYRLRPEQAEEVRRTRRNLESGKTRIATDDEVSAFKKKSLV
jgi:hypothetical protein